MMGLLLDALRGDPPDWGWLYWPVVVLAVIALGWVPAVMVGVGIGEARATDSVHAALIELEVDARVSLAVCQAVDETMHETLTTRPESWEVEP